MYGGDVVHALGDRCLAGVEDRQQLERQTFCSPLALLRSLLLDAALVVLELGLHPAGHVQVLVTFGGDLLGHLDHLDKVTLEGIASGDVGVLLDDVPVRRCALAGLITEQFGIDDEIIVVDAGRDVRWQVVRGVRSAHC